MKRHTSKRSGGKSGGQGSKGVSSSQGISVYSKKNN